MRLSFIHSLATWGVRAQAFLLGGDTQLQFARAWAVAVAAYGCDVVRPVLLRELPIFKSLAAIAMQS